MHYTHLYTRFSCLCVWSVNIVSAFGVMYVYYGQIRNQDRKSNWNVKGKTEIQIMTHKQIPNLPQFSNATKKNAIIRHNDDNFIRIHVHYFIWIFFPLTLATLVWFWMSVLVRYDTFGVFGFFFFFFSFHFFCRFSLSLSCFSSLRCERAMYTYDWHIHYTYAHTLPFTQTKRKTSQYTCLYTGATETSQSHTLSGRICIERNESSDTLLAFEISVVLKPSFRIEQRNKQNSG